MLLRPTTTATATLVSSAHLLSRTTATTSSATTATFPFATPRLSILRSRGAVSSPSSLSSSTRRARGAASAAGIEEEREVAKGAVEVDREAETQGGMEYDGLRVEVGSPPSRFGRVGMYRMNLGDRAFFLLAFIACTTSIAFASLVFAVIPTLHAMKRAAISLAKLADVTREELPSTMAAVRLSGMEISDLTLELSDLSQEIADGVSNSTQAVQAAGARIKQIGSVARQHTMSMIHERANLPAISLQPVVKGAARKTSSVVNQAKKTFMNIISHGDNIAEGSGNSSDKVEA